MEIVNSQVEKYLGDLYDQRHEVLKEMEAEARKLNFPIVGPPVGKLLYQLARLVNARRIFEMGSGYGYSAFWWALAMSDMPEGRKRLASNTRKGRFPRTSGRIFLTERSKENREKGEAYLKRAGLLKYAEYNVGDAFEIFDRTSGKFDIVFIDIEKQEYPTALEKAVTRIRRGGLLVADNVLWSGKVVEEKGDASTEGIKEFNRRLFSMKEFAASIVPVRDGVAVAFKL